MLFILGFLISFLIVIRARRMIDKIGNYENIWGVLTFWTMPMYIIASIILFVLL